MATLRMTRSLSFRTEADAAHHIASCLEMRHGIETPMHGVGYDEAKARIVAERGADGWRRVYKQANREAWDRDGYGGVR